MSKEKKLNWMERMKEAVGEDGDIYAEFTWLLYHTPVRSPYWTPEVKEFMLRFTEKIEKRLNELRESRISKDPVLEDGHGSAWSKRCPVCEELSMQIVRPGSVQCGNHDCPQWDEDDEEENT